VVLGVASDQTTPSRVRHSRSRGHFGHPRSQMKLLPDEAIFAGSSGGPHSWGSLSRYDFLVVSWSRGLVVF